MPTRPVARAGAIPYTEKNRHCIPSAAGRMRARIIRPYIGDDALLLERAAGSGSEAESVIPRYRQALHADESE